MKTFRDQSLAEWWNDGGVEEEEHIMDYLCAIALFAVGVGFGAWLF